MSFAVHHGPNGSFKTFSVVQRFLIEALYEGRTVVTNIRGMDNIQNIEDVFKKPLPPMAELIFIDWEDPNCPHNVQLLQRWFHWIPFGALFILDECHNFYEKDTDAYLSVLDDFDVDAPYYLEPMGGSSIISPVNGKEVFRPKTLLNAFRMHRHFEWDIFFTTPDIDFLPKKIRLSAEFCYRHRNLSGLVLWKNGKWKEVQHSARTNGDSVSSALGSEEYTRDKRIFECYSSTATGAYKESIAGKSIFGSGKVKFIIIVWFLAVGVFAYFASNKFSNVEASETVDEVVLLDSKEDNEDIVEAGNIRHDTLSDQFADAGLYKSSDSLDYPLPFDSEHLYIKGFIGFDDDKKKQYLFVAVKGDDERLIFHKSLQDMGYSLFAHKDTSVVIRKIGVIATYKVNLLLAKSRSLSEKNGFVSSFSDSNNSNMASSSSSSNKRSIVSTSHSTTFSRFERDTN